MPVKMADDPWLDSRSISSFQTFPRAAKTSNCSFSLSPSPSPSLDVTISATRTRPALLTPNGHCTPSAWASPGSWTVSEAEDVSRDVELIDSLFNIEEPLDSNGDHQSAQVWDIDIGLGVRDRRFGFSVVGGSDEGLAPRIDEITTGSPADRADLEVGDEILEVNGKSLEDATHTEVISHIHQCIKSRTICLRVKRKTGNRLALDLAQNSNVQDAFVIAVEQQAKERLEKLSALQQIKPVDMTKLSQQLSQESPTSSQELNGIIEENPIYVTSVPNLATRDRHQGPSSSSSLSSASSSAPPPVPLPLPPPTASASRPDAALRKTLSSGSGTTIEMELKQSFGEPATPSAHREVAVDVPDSFVGLTKAPPRYPGTGTGTRTPTNTLPKTKENGSSGGAVRTSAVPVPVPVPAPREAPVAKVPMTKEETDKIRKYQEELRKRREEEERLQKEEDFLRNSLRGSKKLQALEQSPTRTPTPPSSPDSGHPAAQDASGVVNTAFQSDDDAASLSGAASSGASRSVAAAKRPLGQLKRIVGTGELISAAQRLQSQLKFSASEDDEEAEDLDAVHALLESRAFRGALAVHNKVQEVWCARTPPTPLRSDARELVAQVLDSLHECASPESAELADLLNKLEVESLVLTHDKVAERDAMPPSALAAAAAGADGDMAEDRASQYTEDSVRIIKIDKTNEPLGATVRNEGESVIVGRIVKGGVAEKSGLLHEGDEVLEVNGIEMRGKSVNDVCDILANMTGTLTFLIIPSQDERPKQQQQPARDTVMHVKANFDYDPEDDLYIPCRELGISFQKGDILHVINQEDPNWWQAYREGEEDQTLAGLVPSKSFQQQREAIKQTIVGDTNNKEKSKKGAFLCAKKNAKKKKKKVLYNANYNDDFDGEEICTYEEVVLYYPRANRKRPIVLIGPPNIGRHELRQKLMEDVERFAAAIPHTSRPKKDGEVDGQDYYFITRQQFEADIMARKFVEHGEYEKNYYGTSLDAIRTVVNSGKICVLNLHPQSLKILKTSDLKPFVVFVAPPSLEKLRQNRNKMGVGAKDDDLKEIIEKAREMEDAYGHYFDLIIVNSDLERTYNQLLHKINVLEREPQWVPSAWLKNDANRL